MELIQTKTYCEKWPSGCLMCDLLLCDGKKKQTAADRIRAMTDEELAEWITKHDCHTNLYGYAPKEAVLAWLKQEADDE